MSTTHRMWYVSFEDSELGQSLSLAKESFLSKTTAHLARHWDQNTLQGPYRFLC